MTSTEKDTKKAEYYGMDIEQLTINTIRTLSMDAVQQANSGHPGTPMANAPLAYLLYNEVMRHNPRDAQWPNRDRFILSAGHASMLLYSSLYLFGYGMTLDDLKNFRQWGSHTAGHPEHGHAPGIETTTGPLGQGFGNGVGMALAERWLAERFNKPGYNVVDHYTYALCSDGDLMEGVASEAASIAGFLKLGKLIYFYDDNTITIDGHTDLAFSENVGMRFEAYGWHVQHVSDVNDLDSLRNAIKEAQRVTDQPSMIIMKTVIAYGSPNKTQHRRSSRLAPGQGRGDPHQAKPRLALGRDLLRARRSAAAHPPGHRARRGDGRRSGRTSWPDTWPISPRKPPS